MRRRTLAAILVILVLSLAVGGALAAAGPRNYRAHVASPEGTETRGQGQAIFRFSADGTELTYKLNVANIENVTQAHIHLAPAVGANGPVVLWLYPSGAPAVLIPGRSNGTLGEGTVTAANLVGLLAGMSLDDLKAKMDAGLTYVNVHTTANPAGEIRGVIR
jgi:hypothetical protein